MRRLWNVPPATALIFNCQMGRGRTTTGMIIGCLVLLRRMGAFPLPRGPSDAGDAPAAASGDAATVASLPPVPGWFSAAADAYAAAAPGGDRLRAGLWGVVRSLLRVLESGNLGKAVLDAVVDAASAMQNLREATAQYRARILAETQERRRATLMAVCLEYLERWAPCSRLSSALQAAGRAGRCVAGGCLLHCVQSGPSSAAKAGPRPIRHCHFPCTTRAGTTC